MTMTTSRERSRLPKRKRLRLPLTDYFTLGTWYFVTLCCRQKKPLFQSEQTRDLLDELLRETARLNRTEVAAYTILPNHLHFICSAGRTGVIGFVREFKSKVAHRLRRDFGRPSPWQRSFFDRKLRGDESLRQKCEYVWMNPVRRGLVRRPEEYRWSGAFLTD